VRPARWIDRYGDTNLLAVLVVFWVASIARVVSALVRHEIFGAEATLALMAVVAVPWHLGAKTRA
jgi:hypothetical protein